VVHVPTIGAAARMLRRFVRIGPVVRRGARACRDAARARRLVASRSGGPSEQESEGPRPDRASRVPVARRCPTPPATVRPVRPGRARGAPLRSSGRRLMSAVSSSTGRRVAPPTCARSAPVVRPRVSCRRSRG